MIEEGAAAPEFELPAVVDGEFARVGLGDYLGQDVVVLAFYPADFNPACDDGATDLDELDLFTMQKDVTILALSADSVYSHRAFAEEFDLHIPLLSDPGAAVAADYGVAREGVAEAPGAEGYQTNRAVVVVDPDGDVEYAWATDDLAELPPVEEIREAVESVGGDETARARYRVGHAHYVEGRRAFTSAMHGFEDNEWMMAQGDFTRAEDEFAEAADHFNTARRFAVDDAERTYFERAEAKAEALWQAAEWLTDAASAYASGEGAEGRAMRQDAEKPLETARDIHEPVAPDDFPPEEDPADLDEDDEVRFLPEDDDEESAALAVDIDAAADEEAAESEDSTAETTADAPASETTAESSDQEDEANEAKDEIDDAELEEITAELEQQSAEAEAAQAEAAAEDEATDDGPTAVDEELGQDGDGPAEADDGGPAGEIQFDVAGEDSDEERDAAGADPEDGAADSDGEGEPDVGEVDDDVGEDDIELELTDPTDGEGLGELDDEDDPAEDPDEDLGGEDGSHGVPDSL